MIVNVLNEWGYEEALLGLSLSFYDHAIPVLPFDHGSDVSELRKLKFNEPHFWTTEKYERAAHRAKSLAFKGGGHNKFLASMFLWVYVQAPRDWWSEYDTYKVATTANSSSTMHTLDKRAVCADDFTVNVEPFMIDGFNKVIANYKNPEHPKYKNITYLKDNLPEGWYQERQLAINYMTLQNILKQRKGHRLEWWSVFRESILAQCQHPYLIEQ